MNKIIRWATASALALALVVSPLLLPMDEASAALRLGYNGAILYDSGYPSEYFGTTLDGDTHSPIAAPPVTSLSFYAPALSPDGSKKVYQGGGASDRNLWISDANGDNPINLTNNTGDANSYAMFDWSTDGEKIVYRYGSGIVFELFVIEVESRQITQITTSGWANYPAWSPDGTKIAYQQNDQIYTVNSDGSGRAEIVSDGQLKGNYFVDWSPQGNEVLFSVEDDITGWVYGIGTTSTDGSNYSIIDLRPHQAFYLQFGSYSPDGEWIIFTGWGDEERETHHLYVMKRDGTDVRVLSPDPFSGWWYHWLSLPNTPPVTVNDTASAPFNTPTLVDVLANDTDEESLDGANLSIAAQPSHGTASVVDGKVRYVPNAGYVGTDSLTYQICDSFLLDQKCSTGVVSLTIKPAVSIMKINGESYSSSVSKYVTANLRPTFSGTATPGSSITVTIHSDPIVLTTTADGDGNWSVTPTFDLPTGEHMVYVTATLAGFTTEMEGFGLTVGGLARTGDDLWVLVMIAIGVTGSGLELLHKQRRIR